VRRRLVIGCVAATVVAVAGGVFWLSVARGDREFALESGQFRSPAGPVPPSLQRSGNPDAGRHALLNAPYVSCGIPYDAYRRLNPETASHAKLPEREGRNAELPYALTAHVNEDGVEVVSNNCLTCHAARINDQLIVGLGNEFGDFTGDPSRLVMQSGNYVRGATQTKAWQHWADRIDGIAPYVQTKTIGVNPATNLTWALMSHLDPETLTWSEEPLIDPPPRDPLPLSVPPWWGISKKNAMFYTTIGRGDHALFMLLASMLCIEGTDDVDEINAYAADVRAFIGTLEAPKYPYSVDDVLAAEGETIFVRECSACHGTYGENDSFPNRVYLIAEVGTDPAYATEATNGSRDRFYAWVARSPYGDTESATPAAGYIAPPLDGIWATAPYLHNGSVPSMRALLASNSRPRYWRHKNDPREYVPDLMGWRFEELVSGQDAETDPEARRQIYDTTLRGYGNQGHTYSDKLSNEAQSALLEYLKTL
jgi:mono/diheme cytochrome c family protein